MRTSLLTIGTEITTGEVLNSNAQWMSERLEEMGFEITHHLSVPDERSLMKDALNFLSQTDLIIVTGGLGPTKDDLTREVVADWLGVDLEFSEEAWLTLQDRAKARGISVRPTHRHQCYFPAHCQKIKNEKGSALGFWGKKGGVQILILPGPPQELQDMWFKAVAPRLGRGPLTPWIKWVFKDLRESEVSERFEEVLSRFVKVIDVAIGYRAAPPLVHVKIREGQVPPGFSEAVQKEFGAHLQK